MTIEEKIARAIELVQARNSESYEKPVVTATNDGETVRIHAARMYSFVDVSFAALKELSELFGTDQIDTDQSSVSGCETCDYGSSYDVTFIVTLASSEGD